MRAFLALPLPEDIRDALERIQRDLKVGRRADPETFHVTLAFLGDRIGDAALEAAHEAIGTLAARPVETRIDGLASFDGAGGPRVLFAAVRPDPALGALHAKVRSLLHGAGLMLPRERFRPHVTLARFPPGAGAGSAAALAGFLSRHAGFGTAPFTLRQVVLYRSTLTPDGPVRTALAEYPLI